jgi:hypothetical protein
MDVHYLKRKLRTERGKSFSDKSAHYVHTTSCPKNENDYSIECYNMKCSSLPSPLLIFKGTRKKPRTDSGIKSAHE